MSPAVCPVSPSSASASSSSIILQDLCQPVAPVLRLGANNILLWDPLPSSCEGGCDNTAADSSQKNCKSALVCFSIYKATNPANLNGSYDLIQTCVPPLTSVMCTPGCYVAAAVDQDGIEFAKAAPVCGDGSGPIFIPMPAVPGAVAYNLYRTADPHNSGGVYQLVVSMYGGEAFESCVGGGNCFRVGFVTPEGATPMSNPQCVAVACPPQVCPVGQVWNAASCACVPNICPEQPCTPGFIWDFVNCDCVLCPVQTCLPSQIWDTTTCSCVTCPVQSCPPGFSWDAATCACVAVPGPDWSSGGTVFTPWNIYLGDFSGSPVADKSGGFDSGIGFLGQVEFLSGAFFNYAIAIGDAFVNYTGPAANCRVTVTIACLGNGEANPNNSVILSLNSVRIVGTAGTGAIQTFPNASGVYIADFAIPAGSNTIRLQLQGGTGAPTPPKSQTAYTVSFQNIP